MPLHPAEHAHDAGAVAAELVDALAWFSSPIPDDPTTGRLNLCYNALDRHVVAGLADRIAVDPSGGATVTFARLLEEVAAWAGGLLVVGTGSGQVVEVRLPAGRDALVGLLACLRIGVPFAHVDAPPRADGAPVDTHEVSWASALAAGRLEPAGCVSLPADHEALPGMSTTALAAAALASSDRTEAAPSEARLLGPLLRGETLRLNPEGQPVP